MYLAVFCWPFKNTLQSALVKSGVGRLQGGHAETDVSTLRSFIVMAHRSRKAARHDEQISSLGEVKLQAIASTTPINLRKRSPEIGHTKRVPATS